MFVLHSFKKDEPDFVVVPKAELRKRMAELHGSGNGEIQSYLCSTESNLCWEVRVPRHDQVLGQIAEGVYDELGRNFTRYLNDAGWEALKKKLAP